MVLARRGSFRDFRGFENVLDRFWRGYGVGERIEGWALPLDVVEEDDNIVVRASLPGIKPEDIEITVENGVLTVEGETETEKESHSDNYLVRERRSGKFHRSLRLSDTLDTDKAETAYENGVVTITLPRVESKKAKRLEIKAE